MSFTVRQASGSTAFDLDRQRPSVQRHHEIDLRLRVLRIALPPVRLVPAERRRKLLRDELLRKRAVVNREQIALAQRLVGRAPRHRLVEPDIAREGLDSRRGVKVERYRGRRRGARHLDEPRLRQEVESLLVRGADMFARKRRIRVSLVCLSLFTGSAGHSTGTTVERQVNFDLPMVFCVSNFDLPMVFNILDFDLPGIPKDRPHAIALQAPLCYRWKHQRR